MKFGKSSYFVRFQLCSTGFNFGAVRGKPLEGEPIGMVLCEEGRRRSMHTIAIPNQDHPATIMMMQLP